VTIKVTVDFHDVIEELDRLGRGPGAGKTTMALESILATSFSAVLAKVHVLSGGLKASGHPSSEFDGDRWVGTIHFARHPGIFELARGNAPTLNHPEGGHYFFDPAYETPEAYENAIMGFLKGD
jgi:hypothetical protein